MSVGGSYCPNLFRLGTSNELEILSRKAGIEPLPRRRRMNESSFDGQQNDARCDAQPYTPQAGILVLELLRTRIWSLNFSIRRSARSSPQPSRRFASRGPRRGQLRHWISPTVISILDCSTPRKRLDAQIRGTLEVLEMLKVTVCYPIVLRLYKDRMDGKLSDSEMKECLDILQSFLLRRAVCNVKNNALDGAFTRILQNWPQS